MLFKTKWNEIKTEWINTRRYHSEKKKYNFRWIKRLPHTRLKHMTVIRCEQMRLSVIYPLEILFYFSVATSFISQESPHDNFYLNCIISFLILFCGQDWRESRKNKMQLMVNSWRIITTEKESASTCLHKWFLFVYIVTFMFQYHQLFNSHLILYIQNKCWVLN